MRNGLANLIFAPRKIKKNPWVEHSTQKEETKHAQREGITNIPEAEQKIHVIRCDTKHATQRISSIPATTYDVTWSLKAVEKLEHIKRNNRTQDTVRKQLHKMSTPKLNKSTRLQRKNNLNLSTKQNKKALWAEQPTKKKKKLSKPK